MVQDCHEWLWQSAVANACSVDPLIVNAIATSANPKELFKALHIPYLPISEQ